VIDERVAPLVPALLGELEQQFLLAGETAARTGAAQRVQ
jgi:hypothetical protein